MTEISRKMGKHLETTLFFDWCDFGFVFKIYKGGVFTGYKISIDLQFLWFNFWIQLIHKKYGTR